MKIVCIHTNRPYLADEASYVPLSTHGLHGPVGDGLLTSLAFGKDHVCVAGLTIGLAFVFVVANIVGGKIQATPAAPEMVGVPGPIQGPDTVLGDVVIAGRALGHKLGLVMLFTVQTVIFEENRHVFQTSLTSGTIKARVFAVDFIFGAHGSPRYDLMTDSANVFFLQAHLPSSSSKAEMMRWENVKEKCNKHRLY